MDYKEKHYQERLFSGHGKHQGRLYNMLDNKGLALDPRNDSIIFGWSWCRWYYNGVLVTAYNQTMTRQNQPNKLCVGVGSHSYVTETNLDTIIEDIRKVVPDLKELDKITSKPIE